MKNFNAGWYLIYTKPRHEKKVHSHLTQMKINSFLPVTKKLRTWHDRRKYVDEPLFPSYVFIYLTDMQSYYEGMDTEGSLYYVKYGKEIARVKDSVVDSIRLVADRVQDPIISEDHIQPGRKLVISEGALTGLSCEVVQYNSKQKLLVRVDLLNRNILLALPKEHLAELQ